MKLEWKYFIFQHARLGPLCITSPEMRGMGIPDETSPMLMRPMLKLIVSEWFNLSRSAAAAAAGVGEITRPSFS